MKKALFLFAGLLSTFFAHGQGTVQLPQQPVDFSQPGLRIDSILSYLQQNLTAADSGEGRRASQISRFGALWRDRVNP